MARVKAYTSNSAAVKPTPQTVFSNVACLSSAKLASNQHGDPNFLLCRETVATCRNILEISVWIRQQQKSSSDSSRHVISASDAACYRLACDVYLYLHVNHDSNPV